MKKLYFIAVLLPLLFGSCKKDRACSCSYTNTANDSAGKELYRTTSKQEVTMLNTGYKTAFYACTHTIDTQKLADGSTVTSDTYCEVK